MFDTLNQVNWLKVGLILAALLFVVFVAIYLFNVPLNTIIWVALIGGFAWAHMGMHGSHGGHGGHDGSNNTQDEHEGHTANANGRGLQSVQLGTAQDRTHRHQGC